MAGLPENENVVKIGVIEDAAQEVGHIIKYGQESFLQISFYNEK